MPPSNNFLFDWAHSMLQESDWEGQIKGDWESKILPYARKLGAKSIGALGEFIVSSLHNKKQELWDNTFSYIFTN